MQKTTIYTEAARTVLVEWLDKEIDEKKKEREDCEQGHPVLAKGTVPREK